MTTKIVVPTLGESVTEATIAKWFKNVGDTVKADEPLVELETDKVTVEVPAPANGVLANILAPAGSTVEVGAALGEIAASGTAVAATPAVAAPAAAAPALAAVSSGPGVMPSAKKIAADAGVDPSGVAGSGKGGRVTKGDVLDAIAQPKAAPAPSGPRNKAALEERVRMTRLRKRIAERLKEAQNTAAMLTTFNEVDMTALFALRNQYKDQFEKKHGTKLGFMSFFVKACLSGLKDWPAVNAEVDGEDLVYKNYYDIGVAVGTPSGLVVPVVRNADQLSFADVEKTIAGLGRKARDGKLSMEDLLGGTFTISNGGVYGSLMSTPILNPPQSAILGMHKVQQRPMVMPDGKIEARPMMYLALSYDHRIIDGREAVSFLVRVKECIEDPQRILLDM